ncbi:hypothetical protein N7532_003693 [Penicillium argentinense]|uniref:CFEM domain-containing protein n=1 Tax=Penicillium argentinense TaxID=1131581 RepID=A0A9W9FMW2_9EURO|nr:uncharacterized protein N7532_003693 [Penicillium argentinense]KAJ5103164.1 hypothetical protein N7532_003693 [Penicillium argentinense]
MKLSIFVPLATFLSFVAAEASGAAVDPDDISNCLMQCLSESALVAGCASAFDNKCTCPSKAFKDTLTVCLKDACTAADVEGELLHFDTLISPTYLNLTMFDNDSCWAIASRTLWDYTISIDHFV